MIDDKEKEDWEVEELLKGLRLAGPSGELDGRVAGLFRPGWWMWVGPVAGFAAGVAATVAVVLMVPRQSKGTMNIGEIRNASEARPAMAAPKPRPAVLIEDPRVSTLGEVDVDGHPARLEYQQPHLIILEKADNGSLVRTDMALPAKAVIRTVLSD
jgi:hypothetical protein